MQDATLKGKAALITGSIGGIGLAAARALAARGCAVMLNGLEPPEAARPALAGLRVGGQTLAITRPISRTRRRWSNWFTKRLPPSAVLTS